jgi:hypothetical protein
MKNLIKTQHWTTLTYMMKSQNNFIPLPLTTLQTNLKHHCLSHQVIIIYEEKIAEKIKVISVFETQFQILWSK